ncbi:hypothetical protein JTE90_025721 [Oedothorax gibbosus]|uniref:Mannosyltransferase n=1 Tax=Oedothorax gibbosus TaxID=931172 RepID=A0AAV6UJG3_9ARAC|nr:hypothetical protein JTE90_025721 [Oedothorax gibbosus]
MSPDYLKNNSSIFFIILLARFAGIFVIKTSFVPDEYWQSLEVAHNRAFGYGYLTWEWKKKIRNCLYPSIFSILYQIFPDSRYTTIFLPKILQATLSSVGDFFTFKLSIKLFGEKCRKWMLFNLLSSWFLFYCSSRTISNMAETSFTACGYYFYPWNEKRHRRLSCYYMWFAGASLLMRPTAVVVWLPLYLYHFWREKDHSYILRSTLGIGYAIFITLMSSDRWFYGEWVVTPYQFFVLNWSNDIGAFYGQHSLLWYFYAGLPVLLGIHLVPFAMGITIAPLRKFYLLILFVVFVFSILSHKEFRFLLPILPLALVICSSVMNEISTGRMKIFKHKVNKYFNTILMYGILLVNIPFSLYMGLFHQLGVIDATLHLANSVSEKSSVLFLMPCHSTPYYSYIHKNITMKFLTCEPNFNNTQYYEEEADSFFQYPSFWLHQNYETKKALLPSHIVMFDSLFSHVMKFLQRNGYHLCYSTFHSHFPEKRTGSNVNIYCR